LIGEPGKAEAGPRVGKRGRRKAKRAEVVARPRKIRGSQKGKPLASGLGKSSASGRRSAFLKRSCLIWWG